MSQLPEEIQNKIAKLKLEGHAVYSLNLSGVKYVYRSINRQEFREIQELLSSEAERVKLAADNQKKGLEPNDPKIAEIDIGLEKEALRIRDRGEERLIQKSVVYPVLSDNTPAGVYVTLADKVMQASSFGAEDEPELL